MSLLNKKQILKKKTPAKVKGFDSETLNGKVKFRRMTAAGHYAVENYTTVFKTDGSHERDFTYLKQAMIAFSMVDGGGKLFWSQDDIKGEISDLDREIVNELFAFCLDVNPPAGSSDLEKNQDGSSSTD